MRLPHGTITEVDGQKVEVSCMNANCKHDDPENIWNGKYNPGCFMPIGES